MAKQKNTFPRSAELLAELIKHSPGLLDKSNPHASATIDTLVDKVTDYVPIPVLIGDRWLYRGIIVSLGLVAVTAIIGAIILSSNELEIPDVVTALGSAAIGALAGLLAPSAAGKG